MSDVLEHVPDEDREAGHDSPPWPDLMPGWDDSDEDAYPYDEVA